MSTTEFHRLMERHYKKHPSERLGTLAVRAYNENKTKMLVAVIVDSPTGGRIVGGYKWKLVSELPKDNKKILQEIPNSETTIDR